MMIGYEHVWLNKYKLPIFLCLFFSLLEIELTEFAIVISQPDNKHKSQHINKILSRVI